MIAVAIKQVGAVALVVGGFGEQEGADNILFPADILFVERSKLWPSALQDLWEAAGAGEHHGHYFQDSDDWSWTSVIYC